MGTEDTVVDTVVDMAIIRECIQGTEMAPTDMAVTVINIDRMVVMGMATAATTMAMETLVTTVARMDRVTAHTGPASDLTLMVTAGNMSGFVPYALRCV